MNVSAKIGSSLRGSGLKPTISDSASGDWLSASRANTRLRASASESSLHEVFNPALVRKDSN